MGQHEDVPAHVAPGDNLVAGLPQEAFGVSRQEDHLDCARNRCDNVAFQYGVPEFGLLKSVEKRLKQQLNNNQKVAPDTNIGIGK